MLLLSPADVFFSKLTFSKNSFRNTIRVSNNLDPDQDRHYICPDLDPNCLHWLSANNKSRREKGRVNTQFLPLSSSTALQPIQELFFLAKAIRPPTLAVTTVFVLVCSPSVNHNTDVHYCQIIEPWHVTSNNVAF